MSINGETPFDGKARLVVDRMGKLGSDECSTAEKQMISMAVSGSDLHIISSDESRRLLLVFAWLAEVGGGLIVSQSEESIERTGATLESVQAPWLSANDSEQLGKAIGNPKDNKFVVAPLKAVSTFVKEGGDISTFTKIVIDGVDSIASSGALSEVESILAAAQASEAQIVLSGSEVTLSVASLSRKYLKDAKNCVLRMVAREDLEHCYYEVGTTLLAKPQALSDIVELEQGKRIAVFCNSPSDADFADVILKKRGVASMKLIGYVPQLKLSKAIQQIQKDEISVLVLTDVAARGVPLEEFDLVINYSVPSDPEIYFHRFAATGVSRTTRIVSLVAALDIAHFHYLKKLGKIEFVKSELPSQAEVLGRKIEQLKKAAIERAYIADPALPELLEKVISDQNVKDIVALLLHNTLTVLPSLRSATANTQSNERADDYEEESYDGDEGGQPQFNSGAQYGRDRNDNRRGGRDRDRGGRGRDRDNRRSRGQNDEEAQPRFNDNEAGSEGRGRRRGRDNEGEASEGRRGPRRAPMLVDRDARLYVGQGKQDGLTSERLVEAIVGCGVSNDSIKRVNLREGYSFVDVPEEIADQVTDELATVDFNADSKFFVRKAVVLSIPRPGQQMASEEHGEEHSDFDGAAPQAEEFSASHQDTQEGPTLLDLDE